jgi:hypothetical protein
MKDPVRFASAKGALAAAFDIALRAGDIASQRQVRAALVHLEGEERAASFVAWRERVVGRSAAARSRSLQANARPRPAASRRDAELAVSEHEARLAAIAALDERETRKMATQDDEKKTAKENREIATKELQALLDDPDTDKDEKERARKALRALGVDAIATASIQSIAEERRRMNDPSQFLPQEQQDALDRMMRGR